MIGEFNALLKQGTWSLVHSSSHYNIVGCSFHGEKTIWCFVECYKVGLVAKGFHQQSEVDYFDTFNHVVMGGQFANLTSRTPFYMVICLKQFICSSLLASLIHFGLAMSVSFIKPFTDSRKLPQHDSSMFIYHDDSHIMILLLHVDDIALTSSSSCHIYTFIHLLGVEFEVKDLGTLSYFCGIKVFHLSDSVSLTQNKYTIDLLN